MKRKEVKELIRTVRDNERKRVREQMNALEARVQGLEDYIKNEAVTKAKLAHPSNGSREIPLNPSDWYPNDTNVVPFRKRTKEVLLQRPAVAGTQRFLATPEERVALTRLGLNYVFVTQPSPFSRNALIAFLPVAYKGNVGMLTQKVNELFRGRLKFYAEVRYLD